jgi:glutaredoxin
MFGYLRRLGNKKRLQTSLRLVLYTRRGCHLCEAALERLRAELGHFDFALDVIDVDSNEELANQYGECVPVVTVGGKERFRGQVNPVLLKRILRAEAPSR